MSIRALFVAAALVSLMVGCGKCRQGQPGYREGTARVLGDFRSFSVRWDSGEVMYIEDYPGFLMGPELRLRPGAIAPPKEPHPFMNVQFHGASFEKQLRGILAQSTNTDDFLRRVRREGYDVIQYSGPRGDGG
jgi:hypothetical protein